MSIPHFQAKYRYRKNGKSSWAGTQLAGNIKQQSEQLVMQKIRSKHPGCEVELVELKWK